MQRAEAYLVKSLRVCGKHFIALALIVQFGCAIFYQQQRLIQKESQQFYKWFGNQLKSFRPSNSTVIRNVKNLFNKPSYENVCNHRNMRCTFLYIHYFSINRFRHIARSSVDEFQSGFYNALSFQSDILTSALS